MGESSSNTVHDTQTGLHIWEQFI